MLRNIVRFFAYECDSGKRAPVSSVTLCIVLHEIIIFSMFFRKKVEKINFSDKKLNNIQKSSQFCHKKDTTCTYTTISESENFLLPPYYTLDNDIIHQKEPKGSFCVCVSLPERTDICYDEYT